MSEDQHSTGPQHGPNTPVVVQVNRTRTQDIRRDGPIEVVAKVAGVVTAILALAAAFGAASVTYNQVHQNQTQLLELKRELAQVRTTLGALQLDVGLICAGQFGAEKCRSSGRLHGTP